MKNGPIKKRPPKTVKERKFVKEYLKSGNGTDAAMKVYDVGSRKSAGVIAAQNLEKLSMSDLMDKKGLTEDRLLGVVDDGLKADKVMSAMIVEKEAGGTTKDFIEVPDHAVRHKFLETALRLKGHGQQATAIGVKTKDVEVIVSKL